MGHSADVFGTQRHGAHRDHDQKSVDRKRERECERGARYEV
jgi:hypothetical protein